MQQDTSHSINKAKPVKSIKQIKQLNELLKKIDRLDGDGLSFREWLGDLAQLLIPEMADWCCIHLLKNDGSVECAIFVPPENASSQAVYEWLSNDLPNDESDGIPAVIERGETKIITEVNPVRRGAEAGIKSYMITPLAIPQKIIGTITFIFAESGRHFDNRTLNFAENLALHLSFSLEKYQDLQDKKQYGGDSRPIEGHDEVKLDEAIAHLKQSDEMIQSLFRVSNKKNSTLDVELILDTLAQEAIQMVNGESGCAGLRTAEGMVIHKYFRDGVAVPFEYTWQQGESIPGWVLKYKVPYGTSDVENDPLIQHDLEINTHVRSLICTPILDTVGEVIGYFDIRNKKGEDGFTINDQETLLTLAPVASIAIQNALAYQQRQATVSDLRETTKQLQELAISQESAREEERTQISRELHDELGQTLAALKFDLVGLADQLEKKDETLAQEAKDITSQVNKLIKTVRRIATELRPGMLEDLGLAASIEWQAQDFEKRSGIECRLTLPTSELTLSYDQSLALFRIFQEALTNVGLHSSARHVDVTLDSRDEEITLKLQDDGRGITKDEISSLHSIGLIGMRERARQLGGTFDISGDANGTTLIVTLPPMQ